MLHYRHRWRLSTFSSVAKLGIGIEKLVRTASFCRDQISTKLVAYRRRAILAHPVLLGRQAGGDLTSHNGTYASNLTWKARRMDIIDRTFIYLITDWLLQRWRKYTFVIVVEHLFKTDRREPVFLCFSFNPMLFIAFTHCNLVCKQQKEGKTSSLCSFIIIYLEICTWLCLFPYGHLCW